MARIEIKNIGPIKEASFDLNKVNVFMGPQSSGKSTIAKIISYCTWAEKRQMLDGFFRENFLERLKSFHNLGDVYFPSNAYFKYSGDYCAIEFSKGDGTIVVKKNIDFDNRKQIYIPAERNFVASIPNLGRYKETNNNILDFLYYWYEAKKSYSPNDALYIPELKINFRYKEEEDRDIVVFDKGKETILQNASSGVQSMIPLYLMMDYLTKVVYKKRSTPSPSEKEKIMEDIVTPTINSKINEYLEKGLLQIKFTNEHLNSLAEQVYADAIKRINYVYSQFIIEEPEQNLFPTTQRDLIYYMLRVLTESERDHRLTFTTHSPYILYALNNCMMGYLVKNNLPEEEREVLPSKKSWIDPNLVSIWQIKNGEIVDIKNEETGTVGKHYFNGIMNEVMEEYYDMLTYLTVDSHEK